MWTDIKLSRAEISKIVQSDGSFGSLLVNLGKKKHSKMLLFLFARDQ